MSSNKQKRLQLKERKARRTARQVSEPRKQRKDQALLARIPANWKLICRRYAEARTWAFPPKEYVDQPYRCLDCRKECMWTAVDQKWWFEVAKGSIYVRFNRCLECSRRHKAGIALGRDWAQVMRREGA